jgi:hypothetical protein
MQTEGVSAIASAATAVLIPLVRLILRLALKRRSRKRRKKQIENLQAMLRSDEMGAASGASAAAWPSAAWHIACEVCAGVVEGIVAGDIESQVSRALRLLRVESTRISVAILRSAGSYAEALRAATSSKQQRFAVMHATVALYRLALFQELCATSYGAVSYLGTQLATGRLVSARAVRGFYETARELGIPCAVYVLMHHEGGLVVLSVEAEEAVEESERRAAPERLGSVEDDDRGARVPSGGRSSHRRAVSRARAVARTVAESVSPRARRGRGKHAAQNAAESASPVDPRVSATRRALGVGTAVEDHAALTTMRGWVTNECVGERATVRLGTPARAQEGAALTVFALYADEEQLVLVDADERCVMALHALFVAEHTVAARVEAGCVVAAVHTARGARIQSAVGLRIEEALQHGRWLGESCVTRLFDVGPTARVVLVTLARAAWV